MTVDRRYVVAVLALASALALWLAAVVALLWSSLSSAERDALPALTGDRVAVVVMASVVALALACGGPAPLASRTSSRPRRACWSRRRRRSPATWSARSKPRAAARPAPWRRTINELVAARAHLRHDIEHKVQEASRDIEQERSRLAALMSELSQSVVVCNLDGRILLYNQQARLAFRALSDAPAVAGGAELMGLGRSIHAVFDPKLVAHALENVRERMRRGAATPSTQFVTATPAGQLLRVTMAPVRGATAQEEITGFVLMLDNITRQFEDESLRDQHLHALTESTRASLGSLQAAVEALDYPDVDEEMRERLLGVIRDEVGAMGQRIRALGAVTTEGLKTRWPLEDMLGADVVQAALRRIESACAMRAGVAEVDGSLWLKVDSFSLLQALASLACRLHEELGVRGVELRLGAAGPQRAHLDLIWSGKALNTETAMGWELDPMKIGTESLPLTVRDVVVRHGGEFWFERERTRHRELFRFRLPLAAAHDEPQAAVRRGRAQPPGVLRLRPVPDLAAAQRVRRAHAGRDHLHGVRHRDHRARPLAGRRDHPDRRDPHRQRQAAAPRELRAAGQSAAFDSRAVDRDPWHPARDAGAASPPSTRCCLHSMPSRRTRCWLRTTRPSTCASCR